MSDGTARSRTHACTHTHVQRYTITLSHIHGYIDTLGLSHTHVSLQRKKGGNRREAPHPRVQTPYRDNLWFHLSLFVLIGSPNRVIMHWQGRENHTRCVWRILQKRIRQKDLKRKCFVPGWRAGRVWNNSGHYAWHYCLPTLESKTWSCGLPP